MTEGYVSLTRRLRVLERRANEGQARHCLLVCDQDSHEHYGEFLVKLKDSTHIVTRKPKEPWEVFCDKIDRRFVGQDLLVIIDITPV